MLTQKQQELLQFINKRLSKDGVSPSYDEMKDALNLASKSGIHRLITALEERGFIRRLPHRARALEVLKLPSDLGPEETATTLPEPANDTEMVPLVGKIAAGVPISAIEESGNYITAPAGMIGRGEHFALTVEGESMIEAGILDGDTVILRQADTARNGEIVVALVEEEEATLKRIFKRGAEVELVAENKDFETRVLPAGHVRVQGILVGLIRTYH